MFIAFSGGPAAAREAYLTRGGRFFRIAIPLIYVVFGAAVPAVVIASRGESEGEVGKLRTEALSEQRRRASGSSGRPAGAATTSTRPGPRASRDPISTTWASTAQRVLDAIGVAAPGTGACRPACSRARTRRHVAAYVAKVAGQ